MLSKLAKSPVSEISERTPICVAPTDPLGAVVDAMAEIDRGAVIVKNAANQIVGIFTERDLMTRVDVSSASWRKIPVGEVMTKEPTCIAGDETISRAFKLMTAGGFRHLPRCDGDGHANGIISIRDILAYVTDFFPEEFVNLPPDPSHEARGRWGG